MTFGLVDELASILPENMTFGIQEAVALFLLGGAAVHAVKELIQTRMARQQKEQKPDVPTESAGMIPFLTHALTEQATIHATERAGILGQMFNAFQDRLIMSEERTRDCEEARARSDQKTLEAEQKAIEAARKTDAMSTRLVLLEQQFDQLQRDHDKTVEIGR